MLNIAIVIPAREGSKGLPGKNLKLLNGKPLIDYSINTALKLKNIEAIALSSDSNEILKRGDFYGINSILRPKELAKDNSLVVEAIIHAANELNDKYKYKINAVLLLQPTFPIREIQEIEEAITLFQENKYSSVISAEKMKEHPCECIEYYGHSKINSWDYLRDPKSITNRQEYDGEFYYINGNFYISSLESLKSTKRFINQSSKFYLCKDKATIDIDNLNDFHYAEYILSRKIIE